MNMIYSSKREYANTPLIVGNEIDKPTGKGVIVAVIDSGIMYSHKEFKDSNGNTRVICLWSDGQFYGRESIDAGVAPEYDASGHGTHVTSIAAGKNGIAYESDIMFYALKEASVSGIKEAVSAILEKAEELNKPVAINISYGNNLGPHDGTSELESFFDEMAMRWKNVICVGCGNEGDKNLHCRLSLKENTKAEIAVAAYVTQAEIYIWKDYYDIVDMYLITPKGNIYNINEDVINNTEISVYYESPTPYSVKQGIRITLKGPFDHIDQGIWGINVNPVRIGQGIVDMWLPSGKEGEVGVSFVRGDPYLSLTVPSTADKVISVGAYNTYSGNVPSWSGRGGYGINKPDVVAPGVDIVGASVYGGYEKRSGTSMATPYVCGAAALLMQWGIADSNDPLMYGEKVKAELIKNALPVNGSGQIPNYISGYGTVII